MSIEFYDGKYSVSSDAYNWVLTEMVPGKDKDGNPKFRESKSFHPNLSMVLSMITSKELKTCPDIERLLAKQDELAALIASLRNKIVSLDTDQLEAACKAAREVV